MHLTPSNRSQVRIRLGLQGPSGSGKTYGALLLAYGLSSDWEKIAVIDTEHGSSNLYSHLGSFKALQLEQPFTPEKYQEALQICAKARMEVIVIDSISHEWDGSGGILDLHTAMTGNSFTNWGKVTPRHNNLIQAILQSPCHVIVTIRSKQEYVLTDKNGKMVPEKVGMKGIQRDGFDYELTTLLELDIKHNATATKDRTSLFSGKPAFHLSTIVGKQILEWCNQGTAAGSTEQLIEKIQKASSLDELLKLYKFNPLHQESLQNHFKKKKLDFIIHDGSAQPIHQKNISNNGKHNTPLE